MSAVESEDTQPLDTKSRIRQLSRKKKRLLRKSHKLSGLAYDKVLDILGSDKATQELTAVTKEASRVLDRKRADIQSLRGKILLDWTERNLTEQFALIEDPLAKKNQAYIWNGKRYRFDQPKPDYKAQVVAWSIIEIDGHPYLNVARIDPGDDAKFDDLQRSSSDAREHYRSLIRAISMTSANER